MDPVKQVIACVCLHHWDTDNSSGPISSFLVRDRHIKEWRQRELPILQPLFCTFRSLLKFKSLRVNFFVVLFGRIGQLVLHVCTVGHAVCV